MKLALSDFPMTGFLATRPISSYHIQFRVKCMRVVFHGIICLSVKTANIRPSPLVAGIRGCQVQNIAVNEQSISYKRVKRVVCDVLL